MAGEKVRFILKTTTKAEVPHDVTRAVFPFYSSRRSLRGCCVDDNDATEGCSSGVAGALPT